MKKIAMLSMALCLVLTLSTSCKSKQSAYKAAYEQAKAREMEEPADDRTITPVTKTVSPPQSVNPVTKSASSTDTRQERITPISGENSSGLRLYSVVIGSFVNRTNAYSLKERMEKDGYSPILAENEQGMLRVIVTSYDNRSDAELSRDAIRSRYYPNFQDAWLLQRSY
ncbi:MAG: SPOR domain-containing protein [Tannerella sp.]|jgi:cell division septation protein DedD|nr:SPOR domain-containing protein [Tannerella sp.]